MLPRRIVIQGERWCETPNTRLLLPSTLPRRGILRRVDTTAPPSLSGSHAEELCRAAVHCSEDSAEHVEGDVHSPLLNPLDTGVMRPGPSSYLL